MRLAAYPLSLPRAPGLETHYTHRYISVDQQRSYYGDPESVTAQTKLTAKLNELTAKDRKQDCTTNVAQ